MDFTFLTCTRLGDLDPDDRLALDVLKGKGYACQGAIWDDPNVDWSRAGVCVLRSTWDYHLKFVEFMRWIDDVSSKTQLVNEPHIVRWNVRKTYLRQLNDLGVPVIPTYWLTDAGDESLKAAKSAFPKVEKLVIKPIIGLATSGVKMVAPEELDSIRDHISELLEFGEVMVQPYLSSVQDYGERSMIFLGGTFSHAARKSAFQALATAGGAGEKAVPADDIERETAQNVLKALAMVPELRNLKTGLESLPYARIDLVRDHSNRPVVLELELVEPSLFLAYHEDAPKKFASALEAVMTKG